MLVKCIQNESKLINDWEQYNSMPLSDILEKGKYYIIYGFIFWKETIYYEILTTHNLYTTTYPSFLFEILDNRLSQFFALGERLTGDKKTVPFIGLKEWVDDKSYFSKLVDGDREAQAILNRYKELLYLEYCHPDIKQLAMIVKDNWVQCSVCTEAWELEHLDFEMCRCPKCGIVFLNPYVVSF